MNSYCAVMNLNLPKELLDTILDLYSKYLEDNISKKEKSDAVGLAIRCNASEYSDCI